MNEIFFSAAEGHLERSYSSLLGALSRKLAWHVRMLQTALNGYRAFAALPEDTDGILDANFGLVRLTCNLYFGWVLPTDSPIWALAANDCIFFFFGFDLLVCIP